MWLFVSPLMQKRHTPEGSALDDCPIASATPYAGITQVRFEGYHLSLYGTPGSAIQLYFEFTPGETPNQANKIQENGKGKISCGQIGLELLADRSYGF
jgi:hypothetical protein